MQLASTSETMEMMTELCIVPGSIRRGCDLGKTQMMLYGKPWANATVGFIRRQILRILSAPSEGQWTD
jgi:hypothetical protein